MDRRRPSGVGHVVDGVVAGINFGVQECSPHPDLRQVGAKARGREPDDVGAGWCRPVDGHVAHELIGAVQQHPADGAGDVHDPGVVLVVVVAVDVDVPQRPGVAVLPVVAERVGPQIHADPERGDARGAHQASDSEDVGFGVVGVVQRVAERDLVFAELLGETAVEQIGRAEADVTPPFVPTWSAIADIAAMSSVSRPTSALRPPILMSQLRLR